MQKFLNLSEHLNPCNNISINQCPPFSWISENKDSYLKDRINTLNPLQKIQG